MATVTPTFSRDIGESDGSLNFYTWVLTTANTDGEPVQAQQWADRTFQVVGTFGGATCSIEGSNDGTNWATLSNAAGSAAATFTVAGIKAIIELPRFIRPNLTVAGSGASLTVTLLARRQQPLRT